MKDMLVQEYDSCGEEAFLKSGHSSFQTRIWKVEKKMSGMVSILENISHLPVAMHREDGMEGSKWKSVMDWPYVHHSLQD